MKILLIKPGYSETLDPEMGQVCSLGDVLRTTPLLGALKERYPEAKITWLVDGAAAGLLAGNPLIDRVLVIDPFVPFQLMREQFDMVINLEKHPGICALADMVNGWNFYGFRLDVVSGRYLAYEKGQQFLDYIQTKNRPNPGRHCWQQNLIEMLGLEWKQQPYSLGYRPAGDIQYDVGLNYMIGSKWPTKKMPKNNWLQIAESLERTGLRISWQQGVDNLNAYMDWISSCRVIVTHDSLGLHLALALQRRVVALFGPTDPAEVFFYSLGEAVTAASCSRMPCGENRCTWKSHCMKQIQTSDVVKAVQRQLMQQRDNAYV